MGDVPQQPAQGQKKKKKKKKKKPVQQPLADAEEGAEGAALGLDEIQQMRPEELNQEEETRARELEEQERKLAEIQEKQRLLLEKEERLL